MTKQSNLHFYLNWAKERIDEMDALVTSLERRAEEAQSESRAKAKELVAELRKKRDEFQDAVKKQADAGEAAWASTKTQLESSWSGYEAAVGKYVEAFGKQIEDQRQIFHDVATAQLKAWHDAVEAMHSASAEFKADRRADIQSALNQMKSRAAEAETNFESLKRAGAASWTAWSAALTESRTAFDRANRAAWDSFKRVAGSEK